MATFNFELNNKQSKKGTYAILLRITVNKKHKRIKTSVELNKKSDWNPKAQKVRQSEPNYAVWNDILDRELEKAKQADRDLAEIGKVATSQNVVVSLKNEKRAFSFIDFAEEYSKRLYESGDYRTYTKYITFLNKLKFFINGVKAENVSSVPRCGKELEDYLARLKNDLLFSDITLSFLNRFKAYLQKVPNSRNPKMTLHPNTINKQFDNFASLYNKGVLELREEGLTVKMNPFEGFECEVIGTNKEKLIIEEIEALKGLDLEARSLLWHCRNYFLFAFYCAGMRAGDLIQLRGTNITPDLRLDYRMDKTSVAKSIKLLPEALVILSYYIDLDNLTSDYIFPLLDKNAPYAKAMTVEAKEQLPHEVKKLLLQHVNAKNSLINKYLNKLAVMAGINKKISMHIARHSFANIARQKNANVYDISKALGHSSIKITEAYLANFDRAAQDETMEKVFENRDEQNEKEFLKYLRSLKPETLKSLLREKVCNN